jgi:uncharacterized membrane protein
MRTSAWLNRGIWTVVIVLALIGIIATIGRLSDLGRGVGPPSADSMNEGYARFPVLTQLHIIPGALFMILGPLQFVRRIRTRYPAFHRWSGRVFAASSLVIGVTALVMGAIMPIGGGNETAATSVFALIFLFAVGRAVILIRQRNVAQHREWMLRAFAVGLAIATIRPIVALFFTFSHLSPREFFGTAFWIGFGAHLVLAEIWIRYTRPSRRSTREAKRFGLANDSATI